MVKYSENVVKILFLLLVVLNFNSCSGSLTSKATGSGVIAGRVTPAFPVTSTVSIVDTKIAALCSKEGNFVLTNVPDGVYRVRAQSSGHQDLEYFSVRVGADSLTILCFALMPQDIAERTAPLQWPERRRRLYSLKDLGTSMMIVEPPCN